MAALHNGTYEPTPNGHYINQQTAHRMNETWYFEMANNTSCNFASCKGHRQYNKDVQTAVAKNFFFEPPFTYSLVIKFNLFPLECCNLGHLLSASPACFPWRMKRLLRKCFLIVAFNTPWIFCKWFLLEPCFIFQKTCASTKQNINYIMNLHKNMQTTLGLQAFSKIS